MDDRLLLKVNEAADRVGIGRSKAYELVQSGEWVSVRIGRCVRIPAAWLEEWVEMLTEEAGRESTGA